ncbi:MAG: hypothetical protein JSU85_12520 [Candidatus Zixiibacteriota bacterium]|nr:MAG: hypothetical protein JSU85_12520 [candidate division Zixibacteria bacterium]
MPGLPPGRTSSVKAQDKKFILQTEFKINPKRAIVTTVSLDGQVIHKVEHSYPLEIETDEDFKETEAAIVAQHESIARKIIVNSNDFIRQTKSIKISRSDRLGVIPGIAYVANVEEKLNGENPPMVYQQARLIMQIGDAITATSRVGALKIAAIISDQGKFVLDRMEEHGHLVTLKNDADIGSIITEIESQ